MMSAKSKQTKKQSIEEKLIEDLNSALDVTVNYQKERRLWVIIEPNLIVDTCIKAYELGFEHLSTISVTDWLDEGKLEVTYHLWSYTHNHLLTIKTKIDRKKPKISSLTSIWGGNAETCERECHELFGVKFEGNTNLTPLFLEDWDGPPPFLKDFNWREFVKEELYDQSNPREKVYFEVKK
ncbi:MAG: NADH-quinone oxidoreductase subunit C [Candidatus Heimdallarchaeaceae archaeon]